MSIAYKKCPKCNSSNTLPIRYGEPPYEAYLKNEEEEQYYIGGCTVALDENGKNMFEYHCKDCDYEYNKDKVIDAVYSKIEKIKGYVGGYFQGYQYFKINLSSGEVFYSKEYEDRLDLVKTLNKSQIKKLNQELKATNILNWKRKYIDKDVMDGTQWSLTIDVNGRKREKIGSNMYPKEWKLYCKIISRVLKEDFS